MPAITTVALFALAFAAKRPPRGGGFGAPKTTGGGFGFGSSSSSSSTGRSGGAKGSKNASGKRRPSPLSPAAVSTAGGGSLERTLEQQHVDNCAKSAALWGTCADDDVPGSYSGGWIELAAPPPIAPGGNVPYGTERLILKSREPLLSAEDCAALIEQMEAHGAANGWDSRYPVGSFTREVNVADIPQSVGILSAALRESLLPAAAAEFPAFATSSLRVNEALVVKCAPPRTHTSFPREHTTRDRHKPPPISSAPHCART